VAKAVPIHTSAKINTAFLPCRAALAIPLATTTFLATMAIGGAPANIATKMPMTET